MFNNLFIMLTDQSSSEMLIGYNKHSRRRDSMVYTNITVNPIRSNYEARLQNTHLHKLVCVLLGKGFDVAIPLTLCFQTDGSMILKASQDNKLSVTGLVSRQRIVQSCPQTKYDVTLISDDILGWMSAIISQNTPIITVS